METEQTVHQKNGLGTILGGMEGGGDMRRRRRKEGTKLMNLNNLWQEALVKIHIICIAISISCTV